VEDYWAHAHLDDPKLREQDTTDDFEAQLAAMEEELTEGPAPSMALDPAVARKLAEAKGEFAPIAPAKAAPEVTTTVEKAPAPEDDFEEVFSDKYG
jgi:hypothetical protein